uniref:Uncharacterized protein n=1 Tax=Triticum urartu TaxID=4572 RepID=A0A8R7ULY6_TRIUA
MLANSQMCRRMIVAWHRHGVEERGLHLCVGASPEQAHGVLHHRCVAGQRDSATVNACEAELLLGHPERRPSCRGTQAAPRTSHRWWCTRRTGPCRPPVSMMCRTTLPFLPLYVDD